MLKFAFVQSKPQFFYIHRTHPHIHAFPSPSLSMLSSPNPKLSASVPHPYPYLTPPLVPNSKQPANFSITPPQSSNP